MDFASKLFIMIRKDRNRKDQSKKVITNYLLSDFYLITLTNQPTGSFLFYK